MKSSKFSALLLICMVFISTATPILGCGYCGKPPPKHKPTKPTKPGKGYGGRPTNPPPSTVKPGPVSPVPIPPVTTPPVTVPPILNPPSSPSGKPCPPTPSPGKEPTCPVDTLKLGACVDLLGGLIHIGLGDPVKNKCCPLLEGLVEVEAAVCLCTTLKLKLLNLNLYVPLALQLLLTCGKAPPPGFTCTI